MAQIKAVLMDGDGSTITHDGIFPDDLQQLITANPQVKWIMATGRSLDLLQRTLVIPFLSTDVPHIVDGGSRLMKTSGEIVHETTISPHELTTFFNQLPLDKVKFLYYFLDESKRFFYAPDLSHWDGHTLFQSSTKTTDIAQFKQFTTSNPPTKIFIRVSEEIKLHDVHWNQNELNIDLTAHGVNKGSACQHLLNLLGLKANEVAFVFNDKNDLPIILHTQLQDITTIKVGEYLPEVEANYTVATPYEVAEILKKLI